MWFVEEIGHKESWGYIEEHLHSHYGSKPTLGDLQTALT